LDFEPVAYSTKMPSFSAARMTAYDGKTYVWKGKNRLISVALNSPVAEVEKAVFAFDCREFEENADRVPFPLSMTGTTDGIAGNRFAPGFHLKNSRHGSVMRHVERKSLRKPGPLRYPNNFMGTRFEPGFHPANDG